jgi:hypothetical protein
VYRPKIIPLVKTADVIKKDTADDNPIVIKRLRNNFITVDSAAAKQVNIAAEENVIMIKHRAIITIERDSRDLLRQNIIIMRDSIDILSRTPFKPSKYVNIGRDENVVISLPLFATKKYSIKFYAENESTPLFELSKITEPYIILEKVNFKHAGWYKYHLYSNGTLVEKYKIFIAIDDKNAPLVREKYDLSVGK